MEGPAPEGLPKGGVVCRPVPAWSGAGRLGRCGAHAGVVHLDLLYLVEVGRSKFADEITVQIGIAEIHYELSQGY